MNDQRRHMKTFLDDSRVWVKWKIYARGARVGWNDAYELLVAIGDAACGRSIRLAHKGDQVP